MNRLTQLGKKAKRVWSAYISTAWTSTLDKLLLLFVAGCLVVLLIHDLGPRLVGWSELFPGGAELWNLLYELSLASLAAYVFYFLVVHLKRQRDREILKPFLYLHTNSIVEDAKFISRKLAGASDNDLKGDFPPTPGVTRGMCRSVNPRSQVPGLLPLRWFELLETRRRLTKESSANIYTAAPFLETQHLKLIIDVDTCRYFKSVQGLVNNFRSPDEAPAYFAGQTGLGVLADALHEYFEIAKRLEEYSDRELTSD